MLVSSEGCTPAGEGTISLENGILRNFEVPRAGEISLLEKNKIVPIGKKRAESSQRKEERLSEFH